MPQPCVALAVGLATAALLLVTGVVGQDAVVEIPQQFSELGITSLLPQPR